MKNLSLALLLLAFVPVINTNAQIHPITYGADGTIYSDNWYKNYVGMLFDAITPSSIAGSKGYTFAGAGATPWGGVITSPLLNKQIIMPQPGDSLCGVPITVSMTGKIALVYRGGGIEFSAKALAAQTAGAIACIIVNDVPGGPVGMASGASGGSVTIPVFMISKADGDAMDLIYLAGTPITMSIATWGRGISNDLGFVPQGIAGWSNYATPSNQLFPAVTDMAFKGLSGAFVANYGTNTATNVKVRDTLRYTPTGGSASVIRSGVSPNLSSFVPADSIYAMFGTTEYNIPTPAAGTGRYDLKYNIVSDAVDGYAGDNTATYSFYSTDSVYSKGRYDFVNNVPVSTIHYTFGGGSSPFLWGAMYYVAHGGRSISSLQFSLTEGGGAPGPITAASTVTALAYKWVDGSGGEPLDGWAQNGEFTLAATGIYSFLPTDSSGDVFKVRMGDAITGTGIVMLDPASWYYVAIDVPVGMFMGADGQASPYPRIYGRQHASGTVDYSNMVNDEDFSSFPGPYLPPTASPRTYFVNSIDSFNYNSQKGLIPSVAMILNNAPIGPIVCPNPVCLTDTFSCYNSVPGGTWSSSTPSVATIVAGTGHITLISAGTTTITYTTAAATTTRVLTVNTVPSPAIIGTSIVCIGSSVTLTSDIPGGTWNSGGTNATISSGGVVNGVAVGTETITYSASNTCGTGSSTSPITVAALPVPVVVVSGLTLSTTTPYTTYQWIYSGSPIGGATSATYDAVLDGAYAVTVTDANGCTGTSLVALVAGVGVKNVSMGGGEITLYPNPTSGVFTLQTPVAGTLSVYSVEGKTIGTYKAEAGGTKILLPEGIADGIYVCRYEGSDGTNTVLRLIYKK